jgi:hypothetical protein
MQAQLVQHADSSSRRPAVISHAYTLVKEHISQQRLVAANAEHQSIVSQGQPKSGTKMLSVPAELSTRQDPCLPCERNPDCSIGSRCPWYHLGKASRRRDILKHISQRSTTVNGREPPLGARRGGGRNSLCLVSSVSYSTPFPLVVLG